MSADLVVAVPLRSTPKSGRVARLAQKAEDVQSLISMAGSAVAEKCLQRQAFELYHLEVVDFLQEILDLKRLPAESQVRTFVAQVIDQISCDPLTGLLRKDAFLVRVVKSLQEDLRARTPCILYADLNKFKYINDHFGHATGDQVIKGFADLLSENIRGNDVLIGRMGGDEFAAYLPSIPNPHTALAIGERIRLAALERDWSKLDPRLDGIELGASIGIACLPEGRSGDLYGCADALLNSADTLMLCAKKQRLQRALVSVTWSHGVLYDPPETI